jgi:hypothetical protein
VIASLAAGAALLGARVNSTWQVKRERQARETERRHVFQRHVFQQETLVALQDSLEELYRVVEE